MKKHIAVLTGKRGGFGALTPTLRAIEQTEDLTYSLIVADQHLYDFFGKTHEEVESLFQVAAFIDMEQDGDTHKQRAKAIGQCVIKATDVLSTLNPDLLLVLGDRGEVMGTCIAAHNLRIPIAHIQGGDISGSLDEPIRHAITKLSHLHFASTKKSAERILKMGEEPFRVHVVGDLHIDQLLSAEVPGSDLLCEKYDIDPEEPFFLVLQHSDSATAYNSQAQMHETLAAVKNFKIKSIIVYPCSDQGYKGIVDEIEHVRCLSNIRIHKNIPAPDFAGLQKMASCLIGNSSAGLIEAPYFSLPAINVGQRQTGRECTDNVIHVPYCRKAITKAIKTALYDEDFKKRCALINPPFGNGKAFLNMIEIIQSVNFDEVFINKRMSY